MKLLTSCLVLIIILISFVRCSINAYQTNEGDIEKREEVQEEAISSPAPIQLSASLINTCRTGYRLTESGICRRVLRVGGTTEKP